MISSLKNIDIGDEVKIIEIKKYNKRLLELGFIPNKIIKKEFYSLDKTMVALKLDGALISIRSDFCEYIIVER